MAGDLRALAVKAASFGGIGVINTGIHAGIVVLLVETLAMWPPVAHVFGFIAAMVACHKGMTAKGGPKGVGDAVNQAVVVTFILSFFVNFILTVFYFNFIPQKGI